MTRVTRRFDVALHAVMIAGVAISAALVAVAMIAAA